MPPKQAAEPEHLPEMEDNVGDPEPEQAPAKKAPRGPGRPRKVDVCNNIEIDGVVDQPVDAANIVELAYHTPTMFKKMILALKPYDVPEVDIHYDASGIHIRTPCRMRKNTIHGDVDGNCMLLYYCARPISQSVKLELLMNVANTIGKDHDKIMFFVKAANPSRLLIVTHETCLNFTETFKLDCNIGSYEAMAAFTDDETPYPLRFTLPSDRLKQRITASKKASERLTIQKEGGRDLQMTTPQNRGMTSTLTLPADKIDLMSNIDDGDIVVASVSLGHVKKFTDSLIGENITIHVDREKSMCFVMKSDRRGDRWGLTMRVFIVLTK